MRACGLLRFVEKPARARTFHETQHPIIQSAERGEDWRWCYIDDTYL